MWEPLPSVFHWVLPCRLWFYQSSLPRRWCRSEDSHFNRTLQLRQSCAHGPGLMRAGPAGEKRHTPWYTVHVSPQCPQEIGLPTLPRMVFQGAAISSEHTSQFLPPGNVAELRCSPPLRGSLEQLVRLSPAGVLFQDTELATLITPEASFERLVPLVDYLAAWKLLPDVSRWVLHTVERGYRIQFGSPPPRCNRVNPTLEGPEQALVMEREVDALLREEAIEVVPPHKRESGFYSRYFISSQEGRRVASHFRSASVEPLSQQTEVQDAQNRSCLRSGPRTGLSRSI